MNVAALVGRLKGRAGRELADAKKLARFRFSGAGTTDQKILFVVGCQRSGTSMTSQIFKRDPNAFVFNELSRLSSGDSLEGLRFDSLDEVDAKIRSTRAPLVIAKPLVESHRVHELAEHFPNARFLWLYRDVRGVAKSNLNRWGADNGRSDLAPILKGDPNNWRSQGLSEETRTHISDLVAAGISDEDAAALFWFSRNSLFFDQNLGESDRVLPVYYRDLVDQPIEAVAEIYRFVGLPVPEANLTDFISKSSMGRGAEMNFSPQVDKICTTMFERIRSAHKAAGSAP